MRLQVKSKLGRKLSRVGNVLYEKYYWLREYVKSERVADFLVDMLVIAVLVGIMWTIMKFGRFV